MEGEIPPLLLVEQPMTSPTTPGKTASRDILFGETGISKGSSPVKYRRRSKIVKFRADSGSSTRPRNLKTIRIELPNASAGTSSRKRPLSPPDGDSDTESLSPLSPLTPMLSSQSTVFKDKSEERWSIEGLGSLVWIHVNQAGQVFDAKGNGDKGGYMWWPAKSIGMLKREIIVRPYGSLGTSAATIRVQNPCNHNILSLTDSLGRPRFGSPSSYRGTTSVFASPKKKQKRDLSTVDDSWQAAVFEILRDKEDEDDGLPPIEFALSAASRYASVSASQSTVTAPKRDTKTTWKQKKRGNDIEVIDLDTQGDVESDWDPPEPDEMLDIPGELVLARDRADRRIAHWPAKLLAYIPPSKPKKKTRQKEPKYRVLWLDDTEQEVPRDWFYACHEPEFGTCEMGKFASDHLDNGDDGDEDDPANISRDSNNHSSDTGILPPSPSPSPVPFPSLSCAFNNLSIRAQLAYIKPVLLAILNENYAPAKGRHDSFMKGGKARAGLGASAGLRGTIPPRDVDKLQKHLCDWCLRDEVRASNKSDFESVLLNDSIEEDAEIRHPLEHIFNAASPSKSLSVSGAQNTDYHSSKENIYPDDGGVGSSAMSKGFSPALTDTDLPPSPPPVPPTSSMVSLLSEDNEVSSDDQNKDAVTVEGTRLTLERQKGCALYENLAGLEKITYCLNVLLPEAVLQLLLWRNGHRTSVELLSDFEEAKLHEKAEKLAEETDWVFDIVRLREMKVRQLKRQAAKNASTSGRDTAVRTRTSSRSRRIPDRYQV
ncbi:hypothetical protein F5051DRAFT_71081 [Lentinula edodes]|nr:hypothetical protein F5051DRAFT_71081 [Lentinula edodes]